MVRTEIRVIYGDTDQMGVVYYANYLRYFEAGRNEFIRAKGLRYRDFEARFGLLLPVVEAQVSYRRRRATTTSSRSRRRSWRCGARRRGSVTGSSAARSSSPRATPSTRA